MHVAYSGVRCRSPRARIDDQQGSAALVTSARQLGGDQLAVHHPYPLPPRVAASSTTRRFIGEIGYATRTLVPHAVAPMSRLACCGAGNLAPEVRELPPPAAHCSGPDQCSSGRAAVCLRASRSEWSQILELSQTSPHHKGCMDHRPRWSTPGDQPEPANHFECHRPLAPLRKYVSSIWSLCDS